MKLNPYLHFQGNCAEALTFYASLFGASAPRLMRYSEAPAGTIPATGDPGDRVMHGEVTFAGGMIMASDYPPGMEGQPQAAVSLSYWVKDTEEGEALFARLADGGAIVMPYAPTFWSAGFGMVQDRFGTHWMVGVPATPDPAG
ncbi:VOC family protein [Thioclava sp. BHET1]|nr:VOC family protein [Thioclava sp. BHET1]